MWVSLAKFAVPRLFPNHKRKALGLLAGWVVGGLQALLRNRLVSLALLRLPQIHPLANRGQPVAESPWTLVKCLCLELPLPALASVH